MIHATAIVDPAAELAEDVEVGPFSIIGPEVKIGAGSVIKGHVSIKGPTQLGKNTLVYPFASVGDDPQDKKYSGETSLLEMGENNVIREYVTINRGTSGDQAVTKIGDNNLFMTQVHIAHDCLIGNNNVFVNSTSLAGHIVVGNHTIFSAFSGVHQFCHVGNYAFVSHAAMVNKDILPYTMITGGSNATVCGLNVQGLKRHGFSAEEIQWLRRAYRVIYRDGLRVNEALEKLQAMQQECEKIAPMVYAIEQSQRGILR